MCDTVNKQIYFFFLFYLYDRTITYVAYIPEEA